MIAAIAFDGDDTLWDNETYYQEARRQFIQLLAGYGDPEEIGQRLDHLEAFNVRYYGYGIKSYALSLVEAAVQVSRGQVTGVEIERIIAITRWMLAAPVKMLPGVQSVLAQLSQVHPLILITKGDQLEQEDKITRSGLAPYFRQVEIVAHKTPAVYRRILDQSKIDPHHFWMVGNSLRSDILPVLAIGGRAVYIPYPHTWWHEQVPETELVGKQFDQLENIASLPGFFRQTDAG